MQPYAFLVAALSLATVAGCGSRSGAPATTAVAAPVTPVALSAPAPGEAQRVAAQSDDFNAAMTPWLKEGYYADIITASRARLEREPGNGGARFSLAYALYYNGDFAQSASEMQKVAALPGYGDNPKVVEVLNNARAMAGRYPGQTLAPVSWEENDVRIVENEWHQLGASLIAARNYDEIERTAAQLTAKPQMMADGSWTLAPFFVGLWSADDNSEVGWQAAHGRIEEWVAARPGSQLAQICLARSWTAGAWLARGDEYADKVSDEAWKTVEERQQKAAPIFQKLLNSPKSTTPLIYSSAQRYGRLGGAPRDWQQKVFERGVAQFPQYTDFYRERATLLLERWQGAPGEWEAFAARVADAQKDPAAGDALYARIVWGQWEYFTNLHDESSVDWPRTKRGFDAILKQYAGSLAAATVYLRLCHQWRDYAQARQVLQVIGGRADSAIWPSRARFAQTRNFLLKAP